MRVRNNNPLDLEGDDGETITVSVTSGGTVFGVNFALDGKKGTMSPGVPLTFTLNKAKKDPTLLTMLFTFSGKKDGFYDITVTGSNGGGISFNEVAQVFAIASNSNTYTFDVM